MPKFNDEVKLYSSKKNVFEKLVEDSAKSSNSEWDSIVNDINKVDNLSISIVNPNTPEEYALVTGDGEEKNTYQDRIKKYYDNRKTIFESLAQERNNLNSERIGIINKYQDLKDSDGNLIDINELAELTGKQFDLESIFVSEILSGFEKAKLSIPAMLGNEVSVQRYTHISDDKSAFEDMLEYDQGIEMHGFLGRGGRFVVRTIGEQGSNLALTLGGASVGVPVPALAFGIYAPQAGADKRVELNSRQEAADQAKVLLVDLEENYNKGNIPTGVYLENKKKYETLIATGDLTPLQVNKAIAASFGTEGAITSVFGTAVTAKKLLKDISTKQATKSTLSKLQQTNFTKANAWEFGKRVASEVVEETSIYSGDQIFDNLITGKEKDWSKIDDTAISAIILSSSMTGPSLAYNTVVMNNLKRDVTEDVNSKLKEFNTIYNMLGNPEMEESEKSRISTRMKEILVDLGFVTSGLEVDALLVGSDGVKQLIENSIDLNSLYKEAGIDPSMTDVERRKKISQHLRTLDEDARNNFKSRLKLIRDSEYRIKAKAREKLRGDIFAEGGVVEQLYGKDGLEIAKKILAKNPDFTELSPRQQLSIINKKHQENFIKDQVDNAKKDREIIDSKTGKKTTKKSDIKRAVELFVYGTSFEESGRKKRKKREEDAIYEQLVKVVNTDVVNSLTSFKNDESTLNKIINKYGDLNNLKIAGLNEEDGESKIIEILNEEGHSASEIQEIINDLKEGSTNGFVTTSGNYIVVDKEAAAANIADGNLLQGTVWIHEASHALDNVTMTKSEKKTYTTNLFEYMSNNDILKNIHDEAIMRAILLKEYDPNKTADKQSDVFYNEYVQYVQDELIKEARKPGSTIWKEAKKASPSFGNMFRGTMLGGKVPIIGKGGDFTLETPQDAMNYLANFIHSWNMDGDLSKQTLRKMKAMKAKERETWAKTIQKSSNVQSLLDRFDINEDNYTSSKLDRMINEVLSKKKDGSNIDFVNDPNALKSSEFGQEVMPIVESITKRLFDPIPSNISSDAGVTRGSFQTELISMAGTLVSNEYNFKQPIDKFISTRLNLRANKLASDLGIKSVEESAKETRIDQRFAGEDTQMQIEDKTQQDQAIDTRDILQEQFKERRGIKTEEDEKIKVADVVGVEASEVKKITDNADLSKIEKDPSYKRVKLETKNGSLTPTLNLLLGKMEIKGEDGETRNLNEQEVDDILKRLSKADDLNGKLRPPIRDFIFNLGKKYNLMETFMPDGTDASGKATGIANTKFGDLYRKGARVDAAITGSTQGLPVQIKRTNVPNKAIFNLIGIDENGNAIKGVQKEFDGAMREFIINLGALINNQQIRQDRPELSRIGDPRPEVLFSKNPEVDRIINLKDLFDIENNGIDKLLRYYGNKVSFNIKSRKGRKEFIEAVKKDLFPMFPREFFFSFNKKGDVVSDVFTASNANYDLKRSTYKKGDAIPKGKKIGDFKYPDQAKMYDDFRNDIRALAKNEDDFGENIEGADWTLTKTYNTIFGDKKNYKKKIQEGIKDGSIEKWNNNVALIHREMWNRFDEAIKVDETGNMAQVIGTYLKLTANDKQSWHRLGAQLAGYSLDLKTRKNGSTNIEFEHAMPATAAYLYLLDSILDTDVNFNSAYDLVVDNYKLIVLDKSMDDRLRNARTEKGYSLQRRMPDNWSVIDNKWWERYFNGIVAEQDGGIDPSSIRMLDGKTFAETFGIKADGAPTIITPSKPKIKKIHNSKNAQDNTSKYIKSGKASGMSTFDFDETLIIDGKNFVVAKDPKTGETLKIKSGDWPTKGPELAEQGYEFNFDDFVNVRGGVDGPLLQKMKNQIKKYGAKNVFVLTARPQSADAAIHAWLKSKGVDIPFKNITGLADSKGEAKADWMLEKFAEGYNDMYFVDDALPNVKAVKDVLDQLDIKSKVVQAKLNFSRNAPLDFDKILEQTKGVPAKKRFSTQEARKVGVGKGRLKFFVPPSAEDFKGLVYSFLGRGREGDAHAAWFKKNLFDPFAKGIREWNTYKQAMSDDYQAVKKQFKNVGKKLNKKVPGTVFTNDNAIRVYLWNKAGFEIPGVTESQIEELVNHVENNSDLKNFADALGVISRVPEGYIQPEGYWVVQSIASDLSNAVLKAGRKDFLAEWIENKNIIFSEQNLNKIEAIYGTDFRDALENMLYRMETGTNRPGGKSKQVNMWLDWINGSVAATMFFNISSAALQTISTVNFINMSDNNLFKASAAFANQLQYWKDFAFIFNSPMLKQRRAGLQIDVSASEITRAFNQGKSRPEAILALLLEKGFKPTQIADSFAISAGGAAFYRNRINTYLKQGMSENKAREQAVLDFQEVAEETQQSSRPDLISMQQAGPMGRIILAWQNTPMQMTRLTKKALSDLVKRRKTPGYNQIQSDMGNISSIIYYGVAQNLIFGALQTGLMFLLFGWDEDEERKKKLELRTLNGALDTLLRGTGIYGAAVSTLKNVLLKWKEEREGPAWKRDDWNIAQEAINLSPPIGSKMRKLMGAIRTEKYNPGVSKEIGFRIENPNLSIAANWTEALTNIPVARVVNKANNVEEALNSNNDIWQRVALVSGWSRWSVGVEDEELKAAKESVKEKREKKKKQEREKKKKEKKKKQPKKFRCRKTKSDYTRCKNMTSHSSQYCYAHR